MSTRSPYNLEHKHGCDHWCDTCWVFEDGTQTRWHTWRKEKENDAAQEDTHQTRTAEGGTKDHSSAQESSSVGHGKSLGSPSNVGDMAPAERR